MDNRRPTNNAPRPLNRTNNFRREGDRPFGANRYQPRDSRDGRESRDNRDYRDNRDNRFQPRNNDRYQSRDDRPPNRDNRYQSRDNRDNRDNRDFRDNRDNRYQGRTDRNDRSQPRNDRFQPRDNKFQPRGRFVPRGKSSPKPWEQDRRPRIVSEMQVTDGKHRGKYLQSSSSTKVRPTARRIRESMFRILYRRIRAGRFLDLCAGAGTVGIEAISRGALLCTFVERSGQMCGYIKKNMEACAIKEGHGEIHQIEVVPFLKKMAKRRRFWDVVYFDPPYDSNYEEVLNFFSRGTAIRPGGLLVVEHPTEMFFPEKFGVMARWRVVTQGETSLSFYEKQK